MSNPDIPHYGRGSAGPMPFDPNQPAPQQGNQVQWPQLPQSPNANREPVRINDPASFWADALGGFLSGRTNPLSARYQAPEQQSASRLPAGVSMPSQPGEYFPASPDAIGRVISDLQRSLFEQPQGGSGAEGEDAASGAAMLGNLRAAGFDVSSLYPTAAAGAATTTGGPAITTLVDPDTGNTTFLANGVPVGVLPAGAKEPIWYDPGFAAQMARAAKPGAQTYAPGARDMGDYILTMDANGNVSVTMKTRAPAVSAGPQSNWGISEPGMRAAWEAQAEEADKERAYKTHADDEANSLKLEIANIESDTSLSVADKTIQREELIQKYKERADQAADAFDRWKVALEQEESSRNRAAQLAAKEGDWQLARDQLASAEKIAAAKAMVDREVAALGIYGTLLAVESQERSKRAASAAEVFNTLAQLAQGDRSTAMLYALRGQAPPSPIASIPPGLFAALGVNPDTAEAAGQQLRGQLTAPPWLVGLLGGNMNAASKTA